MEEPQYGEKCDMVLYIVTIIFMSLSLVIMDNVSELVTYYKTFNAPVYECKVEQTDRVNRLMYPDGKVLAVQKLEPNTTVEVYNIDGEYRMVETPTVPLVCCALFILTLIILVIRKAQLNHIKRKKYYKPEVLTLNLQESVVT